ncbi:phosphopantetheine-binding protein [Bacillus nitratireducens]|uniref:phosphopantetheine-binding protein n=1 Tax=Bacillus nitratireducens TaxID=2026193 RepID=UPI001483A108|nr:phosphopantetheine-binding protein [Bacillus nitratireducens]MED0906506.1 phosphopantetheine-binding protein [Bacillus nitratireducens]
MDVKVIVYSMLKETFSIDPNYVFVEDRLKDLGIDSLEIIELIIELEKIIGRPIDDKELVFLNTVGDIIKFITTESVKN